MFKKIISRIDLTDNKKRVQYISKDDIISFEKNVLRLLKKYELIGKKSHIQSYTIEQTVDELPKITIKEICFPQPKKKGKIK